MTDQATRIVPAGWYEDPASPAHVRWWNGLAWTEHTAPKPATPPPSHGRHAAEPSTATGSTAIDEVTAARIAEARELERQYGISTAEHELMVQRATEGSLQDRAGGRHAAGADRPVWGSEYDDADEAPRTATASAWLLALWPVLTLVALVIAAYVGLYVSPEPAVAGVPLVFAVALLPYLLSILWAVLDARKLRSLGFEPPSPLWSLAGPLGYLIARRVTTPGSGPLVMFVALLVLFGGGPAFAFATGSAAPLQTAAEVQQTVRDGLVGSGDATAVSCPFIIETTTPGTVYTCSATLPDGTSKTVFVTFDDNQGTFSYSLSAR